MFEKQWLSVAPVLFTTNGTNNGLISVTDTAGFKVKAQVVISAAAQNNLTLQVKRVLSSTQMIVGPISGPITNSNVNLTAYTLAAGAFIYQDQQARVTISPADIIQAVYNQEPVVSISTSSVDQYGNIYDSDNPFPVAFDGTVSIGQVEVKGTNGNFIEPNPDGSLNVNIVPSTNPKDIVKNIFGTAAAVISGATTVISQYTVPLNVTSILERIVASGENIGTYIVLVNNVIQAILRTYYAGGFNVFFDFTTGQDNGFLLQPGDNVTITVLHNRPSVANFDARIQVLEITT